MNELLLEIKSCKICEKNLPLGPRPIVAAHPKSKILIIGQAPGAVVHKTGVPWDDKSGENLRKWMDIDTTTFYNVKKIGLIPMGFCYPGRGKSGDNPPTKECAPKWHNVLLNTVEKPELIVLIGKYAQDYYLGSKSKKTLTETVKNYKEYLPKFFVLPHPSPRNNIWQAKNEWFKTDVLPGLKSRIEKIL
ncbi:uracil-DNA glycosylase family protein [Aquimarina sp. 2304DJ70-9]|uniref:uracil-DNA glycosylase family protein n=1 Tax=Aquimarina penaris TaxID=3231044 RepID=UPI003461CFF8